MARVGSGILADLESELDKYRQALDYAPGLDFPNINTDDWGNVSKKLNALKKSVKRARRYAECVEDRTAAKRAEDIIKYPSGNLYRIMSACKRRR